MIYDIPSTNFMLLKDSERISFSEIFNVSEGADVVLSAFGYSYDVRQLALKRYPLPAGELIAMRDEMYRKLPYISLQNETARREFLIAPVILKLLDYHKFMIRAEYPLNSSSRFYGVLDYWLQAEDGNMLVIEAKHGDMARGFTQLATQLIALEEHVKTDAPIMYGAITLGNVWQFCALYRKEKRIVQDADLFNYARRH